MKMVFVLAAIFFVGCTQVYAAKLTFAQVTDIHYSLGTEKGHGRCVDCSRENLVKIINDINQRADIQFVVFSGDLIDKSDKAQLESFLSDISALNKPYYVLPGNHDAHEISGMAKETFWRIVADGNPYQKDVQSNQKIKLCNGFEMLLIDASAKRFPSSHGYFSENTLTWLNNSLEKSGDKKVIIFQHFPVLPPLNNPSHEILNPDDYKNIISKYHNIVMVASGHYHGGNGVVAKEGIYHVATPSALNKETPYRIFKIDYNKKILAPARIQNFDTYVQTL